MDASTPPADGDRLGAVAYLAKRVSGMDTRKAAEESDRFGLFYGILFQTKWQARTGRNRYRCFDGKTETVSGSPRWMHFNWTLTGFPYDVYRKNFEGGARCTGSLAERVACSAWVDYFRQAAKYREDLAAGRYDGLARIQKPLLERANQAAMWRAHTASLAFARSTIPGNDPLPVEEEKFLFGWARTVKL